MNVLITGASSGIGKEMAIYLNGLGHKLYIASRNIDALNEIKNELENVVECIKVDLNKEDEVYSLYNKLKDKDIDILINNAGFGLYGLFNETSLDKELEMINVNIKAPHILTKLFLNDFIKKNNGYILNVSSCAGFLAGPKMSTYYASKNYLTKLTMAINEELRKNKINVYVGCLNPGPVSTNFNKVAGCKFHIKAANSEYISKYAIDKMFKRKMIILPTFKIKLSNFLNRFIPYRLSLIICYKLQDKKGR